MDQSDAAGGAALPETTGLSLIPTKWPGRIAALLVIVALTLAIPALILLATPPEGLLLAPAPFLATVVALTLAAGSLTVALSITSVIFFGGRKRHPAVIGGEGQRRSLAKIAAQILTLLFTAGSGFMTLMFALLFLGLVIEYMPSKNICGVTYYEGSDSMLMGDHVYFKKEGALYREKVGYYMYELPRC